VLTVDSRKRSIEREKRKEESEELRSGQECKASCKVDLNGGARGVANMSHDSSASESHKVLTPPRY